MPSPNRVCKYSNCNTEYFACSETIRLGGVKAHCCSHEHYSKWQTEVKYFRGEDISGDPYLEEMVLEGTLPPEVLPQSISSTYQYAEPEFDPEPEDEMK